MQGETGPLSAFFPFSSAGQSAVPISITSTGDPEIVQFCGFGPNANSQIYLKPGDWNAGTITLSEAFSTSNYGPSFIMPNDGIIRKIYVTFGTKMGVSLEDGSIMYPFVCIAVANPTSLVNEIVYTILPDTFTYTDPYIGDGGVVPKFSIRKGMSLNLNVEISEGALVAIVMGWRGENVTNERTGTFSVFGGIYID